MANKTTSRKAVGGSSKSANSRKGKNSILRDHNLDQVIQGKRKRQPTQRALEAVNLLHPSKKIKKSAPKKVKRLGTMQRTAKEGQEFLKASTTPTKRAASNTRSPVGTPSKGKSTTEASPAGKSKRGQERSRSRSQSKSKTATGNRKAKGGSSKSRSQSAKRSAPAKGSKANTKGSIRRTKTMTQTLKDAEQILGTITPDEDEASQPETPKKNPIKRTKTMAETMKEGKAYLKSHKGSKSSKRKGAK